MANRPVLAANWKMNPISAKEAGDLVNGILDAAKAQDRVQIAIFPPYIWLL
ncbi:MAG: triose-phosphate isomerase, partial [Chloroflexi bacterium]